MIPQTQRLRSWGNHDVHVKTQCLLVMLIFAADLSSRRDGVVEDVAVDRPMTMEDSSAESTLERLKKLPTSKSKL